MLHDPLHTFQTHMLVDADGRYPIFVHSPTDARDYCHNGDWCLDSDLRKVLVLGHEDPFHEPCSVSSELH